MSTARNDLESKENFELLSNLEISKFRVAGIDSKNACTIEPVRKCNSKPHFARYGFFYCIWVDLSP